MKTKFILFTLIVISTFRGEPAFAGSPTEWTVSPNEFEYFMTVTAGLKINQLESNEPGNVIAAFVGDECRGVARTTEVNGEKIFFLMVYSNTASESIVLRCYLSESDMVVNSSNTFLFESGSALGSIANPYFVHAIDSTLLSIGDTQSTAPQFFQLLNNYPNPFNGVTTIRYDVIQSTQLRLSIYNIRGKLIRVLFEGIQPAGRHQTTWQGKSQNGQTVSSGAYVLKMESETNSIQTKKLLYMK